MMATLASVLKLSWKPTIAADVSTFTGKLAATCSPPRAPEAEIGRQHVVRAQIVTVLEGLAGDRECHGFSPMALVQAKSAPWPVAMIVGRPAAAGRLTPFAFYSEAIRSRGWPGLP